MKKISRDKGHAARVARRAQGGNPGSWRRPVGILLLFLWFLPLAPLFAADEPIIAIDRLDSQWLRAPALFWVTPESRQVFELPFDQFRPLGDEEVNRGITAADHWVRVRLSNEAGATPVRWVIHHETAYLDEMSVYLTDSDGAHSVHHLTDRESFTDRPLDYRRLGIEHETPAQGYTDVLLRLRFVKADAMSLNLNLVRADLFHAESRHRYLWHGLFFGVMGSLFLVALSLAVSLRQRIFAVYGAFLGLSVLMWAQVNGFGFQFLWPNFVFLQNEGVHIVYLLVVVTALWFSRLFLKTPQWSPAIDRVIQVSMAVFGVGILLRLAGFYVPVLYLSYAGLCSLAGLSVLGWVAFRRGMGYARWYALAWGVFGLGLLLSVFSASGAWFNWGMRPLVFAQVGNVLEVLLLMLALNDRLAAWHDDHQQTLRLVSEDPLTGLGNRRALADALGAWRENGTVMPGAVFLIMIDLDHFKSINDRFGHDAGDQVLIEFGVLLRRVCRPGDVCVRYGGEEFAVLLQAPGLQQAREVAERIRTEFAEKPTVYGGVTIAHTLTIGLSELAGVDPGQELADLFRQADSALYSAKSVGRNRTVVYA